MRGIIRRMYTADQLVSLFQEKGHLAYDGEGVTQLEHAWQCGQLALQATSPLPLQLASWLHDVGHLMTELEGSPTLRGVDDRHENLGAEVCQIIWGPDVAEPVRLHVQAKRYLAATHPGYQDSLSPDSQRSLALQGGVMQEAECKAYAQRPYARQALQLRSWDDLAKRPGWFAPSPKDAIDSLRALIHAVSSKA